MYKLIQMRIINENTGISIKKQKKKKKKKILCVNRPFNKAVLLLFCYKNSYLYVSIKLFHVFRYEKYRQHDWKWFLTFGATCVFNNICLGFKSVSF